MLKKFFFLSMSLLQISSVSYAESFNLSFQNINGENIPGMIFSIEKKMEKLVDNQKIKVKKSSGFGVVSGEVIRTRSFCTECKMNQLGYNLHLGKRVTTIIQDSQSLASVILEHERTPVAVMDHGAGVSLSLLEGFYLGGLTIGDKTVRAVLLVGAGGRLEVGVRNGLIEIGGEAKARIEFEKLGLKVEARERATWSVFLFSRQKLRSIELSSHPTLAIIENGKLLDKIKFGFEKRQEVVKTMNTSTTSNYTGFNLGFRW